LADGRVLVAGGVPIGIGLLASVELYDPGSGTWTATTSMVDARAGHAATSLLDGTVLVSGGHNSIGVLRSAERYDPGSGN
jgi:hypothetical protein